jgi:hypothetical protein
VFRTTDWTDNDFFNRLPSSENRSRCLETTDHHDQGSEDANKAHKQAQRADRHPAGHPVNAAGHHD